MKPVFATLIAASLLSVASLPAKAAPVVPAWNCNLNFDASGAGLQFIVGFFELVGPGNITCIDADRDDVVITPIKVTLGGEVFALRGAVVPYMTVYGSANNIALPSLPTDIFGKYSVMDARGSFIVGGGVTATVRNSSGMTFSLVTTVTTGLGAEAGMSSLTIGPR